MSLLHRIAMYAVALTALTLGACSKRNDPPTELPPHLDRPIFNEAFTNGYTLTLGDTTYRFRTEVMGDITLSSGKLIACDPLVDCKHPLAKPVPTGRFPVHLAISSVNGDERVALAKIVFKEGDIDSWEMALFEGDDPRKLKPGSYIGYGVDSATGGFADPQAAMAMNAKIAEGGMSYIDGLLERMRATMAKTRLWYMHPTEQGEVAMFMSGMGDGSYPTFWGYDKNRQLVAAITDFRMVLWAPKQQP